MGYHDALGLVREGGIELCNINVAFVKVHIDNRIDPFMSEFSGEDHIRGQMSIGTLADLDAFRARYDNDAFLINTGTGYSYLLYEIDTYAPDRYRVVYDNTVDSSIEGVGSIRWIIIECV